MEGRTGRRRPHLVVMVLFDCVQLLDVTGPLEVYASANDHGADYRLLTASCRGREVRTTAGARLVADTALEEVSGRIGTLIVPGRFDWRGGGGGGGLLARVSRFVPPPPQGAP